jgi:hypothetical protein
MIQRHKVIVEHNVPSPIRKTTSLGASTKAHDLVMKNEEVSWRALLAFHWKRLTSWYRASSRLSGLVMQIRCLS